MKKHFLWKLAALFAAFLLVSAVGCKHSSSDDDDDDKKTDTTSGDGVPSFSVTGSFSYGKAWDSTTITITLENATFSNTAAEANDFSSYFESIATVLNKNLTGATLTGSCESGGTTLTLTANGTKSKDDCGTITITSIPAALVTSGEAISGDAAVSYSFGEYGTPSSFIKYAEKITGTDSAIAGLDTNPPSDPTNNSVDMTTLQATLAAYDSEDDIAPKVKVTYHLASAKWVILHTADAVPTADSEYTLASESYTGLLDAVNKSVSYLDSGRSSKQKILVACSGSTGTAAENTISVVNKSDRMAYTHSITLRGMSNIILDFGNNTIYVDTSAADSDGKNISAFIDLERGANNISVRNLTLTGSPSYGIFMAQASNIVCANIHFAKAVKDSVGPGIGIRPQSIANAGTNVELSRWSHDLYFKNISANGIGEHVVETFNAYNVYMDEIEGVDIGGNAVLLNGTYNATIGTIRGVRCCTGGGYAAFRCANDVGPNVNVHYIYSEACGRGIFFVSTVTGVTIDKLNVLNAVQGILYNSCEFVDIRGGKIQTNGGTITYYDSSTEENSASYSTKTKAAQTSEAILMVNGSSSDYLGDYHNTIQNVTFTGFTADVSERTYMAANYNTYTNNTMKAVNYITNKGKSDSASGPGIYNIINDVAGSGDNAKSGNVVSEGGFTAYQSTKTNGYVITAFSGSGAVSIPSTISGNTVTEIGDFAFWNNNSITSVTIPNSVVLIGDLAFADCTALTTVTITGGGEVEIDAGAFRNCTALREVSLTGVKYLRHGAFANCTALTAVSCPESLVYFGANCFYNDNITLTIAATDTATMTMEPYAFFFIGRGSTIKFTGVAAAATVRNLTGNDAKRDYSVDYLEKNIFTAGYWDRYFYHIAVPPTYK